MAAFLLAAYDEDEVDGEARTVLRLHPRLAPYKVAVLPLSKKDTLTPLAQRGVRRTLSERYMVDYDETQSIGRRYRRQDEIGTPLCVTVDFDSLEDKAVTIRDRDTTEQVRVPIDDVVGRARHPARLLTGACCPSLRTSRPSAPTHQERSCPRSPSSPRIPAPPGQARRARRRRFERGHRRRPDRAGHAALHPPRRRQGRGPAVVLRAVHRPGRVRRARQLARG